MKKIISLIIAFVFIFSCATLTVGAVNPSPEVDDVISNIGATDVNNNKVSVNFIRRDELIEDLKPVDADDKIVAQYDVTIEGTPKYPITVTVDVAGVKKNTKIYILAKDEDGSVQLIDATVIADGKVKFVLDKYYSVISFVTDKETATHIGESDKTGDNTTATVSLAAVALILTKRRVNNI